MTNEVDAVIAALQMALKEAERSPATWWKVRNANRWIDQLPNGFFWRWRHLKLFGDSSGEVTRLEFVGHVRATIAYLSANKASIQPRRFWLWPAPKVLTPVDDTPIDAEFEEVQTEPNKLQKPSKPMRVVK